MKARARRFTLTQRVIWAVAGTVALLMGLQAVLAYVAMDIQEDDMTNELLRRETQFLVELTLRPGLMPVGPLQASQRVTAYLTRAGAGDAQLPRELQGLRPGVYQLKPNGQILHVAVLDTEDGRLSVVLDATSSEMRVRRFGLTLAALWLVCVGAAALMARAVAALAVGPIVEATRTIARWAPDRPTTLRVPVDETAILLETFNRFRDRADEAVAREREFAANLNHEIRTPLTAIRTDAELIALEVPPASGPPSVRPTPRQRLERIVTSVDEISATMESMLASSAGRPAEPQEVDLAETVAMACEGLVDGSAAGGLRIEVAVPAGQRVVVDLQALLTVCRNIVRNALEHAAPARLTIEGSARALRFIDDGPGIEPARLANVFERYQRARRADDANAHGNRRRGLGLAIARRLCDLRGWSLTVRSPVAAGRGTMFELVFDAIV